MQNISYIKKRNKIIKYLFLTSGALVLLLIFAPYIGKDFQQAKDTKDIKKTAELPKEFSLTISNSVFEGHSRDNLPYKIIAKAVTKQNNNIYNLSSINADYKVSNGDLEIFAESGMLDETTKEFILSKNVQITFDGLILTSEKINFDLKTNSAVSDQPVEVNFKNSKIQASSFNASEANNLMNFEGNVVSSFDKDIISNKSNLNITSDFLNLDNNNSSASFKGSVTILFDDITLKTDYLKLYYTQKDGKKSISRVEIPGKLKAIKNCNDELVIADKGEYVAAKNELTLLGNVVMNKHENVVITDKMIYVTKLKLISKKD